MIDHLAKANNELTNSDKLDIETGYLCALQSIAHGIIALVERLDAPKSRIAPYDWSAIMDEVAESIGQRVRSCPHCTGEECSH